MKWVAAQSMVAVVPIGEAFQVPFVDPSTVKAGHVNGSKLK